VAKPKQRQELEIALLVMPVDKPAREAEVGRLAAKLVQEVRAGASFEEVSRQFSNNISGGRIEKFWVKPEQLDPAVARLLEGAEPGAVTDPLRNQAGFTIIKVYDARALEKQPPEAPPFVALREIVLKLKDSAGEREAGALLAVAQEVAKNPGSCTDKTVAGIEDLQQADIEVNRIESLLSALPAALQGVAASLLVGGMTPPMESDGSIRLYMRCEPSARPGGDADREQIGQMLIAEKLQLEAQKYLRNLRRDTFIELR
jgi:peptidyl-prolyl cis-trans isomerase SurA